MVLWVSLLRGLPAKIKYVRMGEVPGVRREQADEEVPRGLLSGGWMDGFGNCALQVGYLLYIRGVFGGLRLGLGWV